MGFALFLIVFFALPNLLLWWWADRRARASRPVRVLVALFFLGALGQVAWLVLGPDTARASHYYVPEWWTALVYLWHLLVVPAALAVVGVLKLVGFVRRRLADDRPTDPSRRRLLAASAALAPPAAALAGMAVALPRLDEFRVRRLRLRIPGLPEELDGATIAHVSDIHYGKFTRAAGVDAVVRAVNDLEADLVLLTGDLIDLSLRDLPDAIAMAQRLEPRRGVFTCEGNHDLIDDGDAFRAEVARSDLRLLRDDAATVPVRGGRIQVLGARWASGPAARREALDRLRAQRRSDAFPILLAHHPHAFDDAEGFPVTLSGHTHGGQLMLNERLGAGPVLFRYWSGHYRRDGRSLVVSNGVGNWFPLRTRAPAEILHLTLARA